MKTPQDELQPSRPEPTPTPPVEPTNIRVRTTLPRVRIGRAICSGDVPFPLTKSQADALVVAGLATITGVF